jgi:hypothetical protein
MLIVGKGQAGQVECKVGTRVFFDATMKHIIELCVLGCGDLICDLARMT